MDAAKTGKMIKATHGVLTGDQPTTKWDRLHNEPDKWISKGGRKRKTGHKPTRGKQSSKINPAWLEWKYNININGNKEGKMIKAKKGIWAGAATDMYHKPPGWDVKKISDKTHKKLTELWKHRERGGWSPAAGKEYRAHLKGLKKLTTKASLTKYGYSANLGSVLKDPKKSTKFFKKLIKTIGVFPAVKSKSYYFKDAPSSEFLKRRVTLAGGIKFNKSFNWKAANASLPNPSKALAVLKKVGKRTAIGKAVVAATVVAGAYEAGKRKLFTKKDKKKVDKKSIGGETVIMKSGGGYIDDLL